MDFAFVLLGGLLWCATALLVRGFAQLDLPSKARP